MPRVLLNQSREISDRQKVLYERYGGWMTTADIMKELGVSRNTAVKFTNGLTSYSPTGKKVYDIRDVATKLEGTKS